MQTGNVAAILTAHAKAHSRKDWEQAVEQLWPQALGELSKNPGFLGLITLWNNDDSREVAVIGLWDTMEHRMEYEGRSSEYVRGLFNNLFQSVPDRPRFIVSKAFLT